MNSLNILINIVVCIVVTGAMVVILLKFLKKLHQIEVDRWGDKSKGVREESIFSTVKASIFRRKNK